MRAVLNKSEIQKLILQEQPLISGYSDLAVQLQPNGFDLTLKEVSKLNSQGVIGISNQDRIISGAASLAPDSQGNLDLRPGSYVITFNEIVSLPQQVMALGAPRSSLLRCGVAVHTAVWDAGYSGRGQALMIVFNPQGFRIQLNARIVQLVFFQLGEETEGYSGIFQGENTLEI